MTNVAETVLILKSDKSLFIRLSKNQNTAHITSTIIGASANIISLNE
jgi:hypothetical protein